MVPPPNTHRSNYRLAITLQWWLEKKTPGGACRPRPGDRALFATDRPPAIITHRQLYNTIRLGVRTDATARSYKPCSMACVGPDQRAMLFGKSSAITARCGTTDAHDPCLHRPRAASHIPSGETEVRRLPVWGLHTTTQHTPTKFHTIPSGRGGGAGRQPTYCCCEQRPAPHSPHELIAIAPPRPP